MLKSILSDLNGSSADIEASAIISADGLTMAALLPQGVVEDRVGAIAAATAMALRLNGLTKMIMWQTASLFESIGTVQDGMRTLSAPQTVVDKPLH